MKMFVLFERQYRYDSKNGMVQDQSGNIGFVMAKDFNEAALALGSKFLYVEPNGHEAPLFFEYEKVANSKKWHEQESEETGLLKFTMEALHPVSLYFDVSTKELKKILTTWGMLKEEGYVCYRLDCLPEL